MLNWFNIYQVLVYIPCLKNKNLQQVYRLPTRYCATLGAIYFLRFTNFTALILLNKNG